MTVYSFFSVWHLRAPIEDVWTVISHPTGYAEWSPYVAESTLVTQGDETGVGTVTRSRWTSALRYNLVFTTCTVRAERPHVIELTSTGDLDGTGRWGLSADGDVTTVRYDWNVCTTKRWVDLLAPVARPAFDRNHAIIMRAGGEGLAARLGVELVRNQSYTEELAHPLVPISATAGLVTLGILGATGLRRVISRSEVPAP